MLQEAESPSTLSRGSETTFTPSCTLKSTLWLKALLKVTPTAAQSTKKSSMTVKMKISASGSCILWTPQQLHYVALVHVSTVFHGSSSKNNQKARSWRNQGTFLAMHPTSTPPLPQPALSPACNSHFVKVRFFGIIYGPGKMIQNHSDHGSSKVLLMNPCFLYRFYNSSDLASLILIRIIPKKHSRSPNCR